MAGRRILPIESNPQVIGELCRYDRGELVDLSARAFRILDIITTPKKDFDDTSTALGFVAMIPTRHPSTGIPIEEIPHQQILVSTSQPLIGVSVNGAPKIHQPDGVYTLIRA